VVELQKRDFASSELPGILGDFVVKAASICSPAPLGTRELFRVRPPVWSLGSFTYWEWVASRKTFEPSDGPRGFWRFFIDASTTLYCPDQEWISSGRRRGGLVKRPREELMSDGCLGLIRVDAEGLAHFDSDAARRRLIDASTAVLLGFARGGDPHG